MGHRPRKSEHPQLTDGASNSAMIWTDVSSAPFGPQAFRRVGLAGLRNTHARSPSMMYRERDRRVTPARSSASVSMSVKNLILVLLALRMIGPALAQTVPWHGYGGDAQHNA